MTKASKIICASDLTELVVIEQPSTEEDGMGGKKPGWDAVLDAWAMIEPGKGKERYVADKVQTEVLHAVYIRFPVDVRVSSKMRVRLKDQYARDVFYNIRAVVDLGMKHQFLELTCEEGVGT